MNAKIILLEDNNDGEESDDDDHNHEETSQGVVVHETQTSTAYIVSKCPLLTETSIIDLLIVYNGFNQETRSQGVVLDISFKDLAIQWDYLPRLFRFWPTDLPPAN
ncbi:hypothetical protein ACSQ67_025822 [Phaseolus vulgaris]